MASKLKIKKRLPSYLKRSSNGGLLVGFIYVISFMSILFLALWQTFESEKNESSLNFVDETNNDSMADITSSIQFLDKEIRKLWDLSNKRNKVDIQKLNKQTIEIENLLSDIKNDIDENQNNLSLMQQDITKNIVKIDELEISSQDLISLQLNLSNIDTQLILLEDSVQALNNYRNQLNQVILEIQTNISNVEKSIANEKLVEN